MTFPLWHLDKHPSRTSVAVLVSAAVIAGCGGGDDAGLSEEDAGRVAAASETIDSECDAPAFQRDRDSLREAGATLGEVLEANPDAEWTDPDTGQTEPLSDTVEEAEVTLNPVTTGSLRTCDLRAGLALTDAINAAAAAASD